PLAFLVHEIGRDVDRQLRDHLDGAVLARFFADQAQQGERQRVDAADRAHAAAARAGDAGRLADRRAQALTRQLQQSEARDAPDLDAGAILLDGIAQAVLDGALVLLRLHVDEVDDDQAAEIAQPQLPGDLVRGLEVRVERGRLDVAAAGRAGGVDVDRD